MRAGAVSMADATDNFDLILRVYERYPAEYIGFCYDSGHAILGYNRMERLAPLMERLTVLHLNDNDHSGDLHLLPFAGKVDWQLAAELIAESPYAKPLSFEVSMRSMGIAEEAIYLQEAYHMGAKFAAMVGADS
ncbi:MAG: hypothetical protein KDE19_24265 [Caldilineaceae bacterium]|nr:hypothetical protein [Caldilineaceae bacterium]